jgi:hypothetical protein
LLEIVDQRREQDEAVVPAPVPPDDGAAWYAPNVRAQYEIHPGIVATISEDVDRLRYDVREPSLSPTDQRSLDRIRDHFEDVHTPAPLTREGALERASAGFPKSTSRCWIGCCRRRRQPDAGSIITHSVIFGCSAP